LFSNRTLRNFKNGIDEILEENLILIIDDMPERHDFFRKLLLIVFERKSDEIYHIYDYENAVDFLERHYDEIEQLFLDHDFDCEMHHPDNPNDREKTGSDVANLMVEKKWNIPTIVHSINPPGSKYIYDTLYSAGIHVERIPFYYFTHKWGEVIEDAESPEE